LLPWTTRTWVICDGKFCSTRPVSTCSEFEQAATVARTKTKLRLRMRERRATVMPAQADGITTADWERTPHNCTNDARAIARVSATCNDCARCERWLRHVMAVP